jgi:hypothetical protein
MSTDEADMERRVQSVIEQERSAQITHGQELTRKDPVVSLETANNKNQALNLPTAPYESPPKYKRVDHVYDAQIRDWEIVDTTADCVGGRNWSFIVRRMFKMDGSLKDTQVEIMSKHLRQAIEKTLPAHIAITTSTTCRVTVYNLFHYRMELRRHYEETAEMKLEEDAAHTRLLLDYVNAEYKDIDADFQFLLDRHIVTYDLLWALFKPGDIVCTATYYNEDELRCFRVEYTDGGDNSCFNVGGTYLDHDGKRFGMARMKVPIQAFKGQKKVLDLAVYPLQYHEDAAVSATEQI